MQLLLPAPAGLTGRRALQGSTAVRALPAANKYLVLPSAWCISYLAWFVNALSGNRVRHYEGKLATLTVINGALEKENDELRAELETAREPSTETEADLQELREEFAKRIAAADKTIAGLKVQSLDPASSIQVACILQVPGLLDCPEHLPARLLHAGKRLRPYHAAVSSVALLRAGS